MKTIDERLEALELLDRKLVGSSTVPGTTLARQLAPERGMQWCLAVGGSYQPKMFFTGPTVEAALSAAEAQYKHWEEHGIELINE